MLISDFFFKAEKEFFLKKNLIIALIFTFSFYSAMAEESEGSGLKEAPRADITVSVSAARTEKADLEVPSAVTVITAQQLENRTIPEAISLFAGIDFRSFNGSSSSSQPSSRGFTENGQGRVLILYDGVRLNNPDMSAFNWLTIPGGKIERIEVVKGGASSLYGDFAVASVINIIPEKGENGFSLDSALKGGSSEFSEKSISSSIGGDALSLRVSALDSRTGGYRERTGTEVVSFSADLEAKADDRLKGLLHLSSGSEKHEMPGGLTEEQYKDDPYEAVNLYDEAETDSSLIRLSGSYDITDNTAVSLAAGISSRDTATDMASWFSYTDTKLDSVSVNPSVLLDFPGIMYGMSINTGADLYFDTIDVKRYSDLNRTAETFSGDGEKNSFGIYSRGEVFLSDKVIFTLSGRYDSAVYRFDFGPDKDSSNYYSFVWGSGLNYLSGKSGKVYVKYEKIFRYPLLDEQIVYSGYGSDGFTKNLDPEKGDSFDAGFQTGAGEYLSIGFNGFYLLMDDEIAYNLITDQNENLQKTIHLGVESFAAVKLFDNFTITGTYNYTIAKFAGGDDKDNDIPIVPGHRFSILPEVRISGMARIYSEIIYSGSYYRGGDTANDLDKIDGYLLFNAGAGITKKTGMADIAVYGKIKNAADKKYAQLVYYTDYYPGNGREIEFGISCSY